MQGVKKVLKGLYTRCYPAELGMDGSSILWKMGDGSGKLEVFWKELAGSWQKQFVALPVMICLREWVTQKKMGKTRTEIETLLKWFVWSVLVW